MYPIISSNHCPQNKIKKPLSNTTNIKVKLEKLEYGAEVLVIIYLFHFISVIQLRR